MITQGKKQCAGAAVGAKRVSKRGARPRYRPSTLREIYTEMRQIESCRVDHHHIYSGCETAPSAPSDEYGAASININRG